MSTTHAHPAERRPVPEDDPFRYGWRYVPRKQADGRVEVETVPLTLEDLLFPQEGDENVHYPSHEDDRQYLMEVFRSRLVGDPMAKVVGDCRVRYDVPGLRPLGPDVALFFNLPKDWDGGTVEVAATGARPALVVEITSPDTRKNDLGIKKDYYHRAGVPFYIIVDARPGPKGRRVKLHGFRHEPGGYEPLPLDDRDRLWVEPMGVWLAVVDARVVCIDGRTGEPFGDYQEQARARAEAEARSAEAEARSAEAEARSAEAEARSAEAEARNFNLEARMLELEAEIRRLRGEG